MTEYEINHWIEQWIMYQNNAKNDYEYSMSLAVEEILRKEAGLDMKNDWAQILYERGFSAARGRI